MAETCGIIVKTTEVIYTILPVSEDYCNPSGAVVIYYDGKATHNGAFIHGGSA